MKKIISVALCVAVFGIVGCANQDKSAVGANLDGKSAVSQKAKCKKARAKQGKFGVEKTDQDTAK